MDKAKGILKFAMRMEKDAWQFYSYYEEQVKSPMVKEICSKFSEIEQMHYQVVKMAYDRLGGDETIKEIAWNLSTDQTLKSPHILADNSHLMGEGGENGVSDLMVIRMAYLIENEFELFYRNALNYTDDARAQVVLKELEAWEAQHKKYFGEQYEALLRKNWKEAAEVLFS